MPTSFIDISKLAVYNRDGRSMNLAQYTDETGAAYLVGTVYFNPLSIALYDCQNFYILNKDEVAIHGHGHVLSTTDLVDKYYLQGVSNAADMRPGLVLRELPSTNAPDPHIDPEQPIAWSPVQIASVDSMHSRIKMTAPGVTVGTVDFEAVDYVYEFPGVTPGDKFKFNWKKTSRDLVPSGYPALNDESHEIGDRRIYRNRLFTCIKKYEGGYLGNEAKWKRVSPNVDEYCFFIYDIKLDSVGTPYLEKVINHSIEYSVGHVGVRYPLEFNVAFNPAEEIAYENVLEIWYEAGGESSKIIELTFYGEGVAEDERFAVWLTNFGMKFSREDAMMLHDYNLKEALPDWNLINAARKDLFFSKQDVLPYIGTYVGLRNLIGLLGYSDLLKVKEYWINTNPNSPYKDKMMLADVSQMMEQSKLDTVNLVEHNREIKFSPYMKKTGFIALSYAFTRPTGDYDADGLPIIEETADMSQPEVFYKLYKMREKLKNEFLPTNVIIKDIIGEFIYFHKMSTFAWKDEVSIYTSETGEGYNILAIPEDRLYIQDISALYRRSYLSGMAMPSYAFNFSTVNPYESGQRYTMTAIPKFIEAIDSYYQAISDHDQITINGDYYWESGDEPGVKIGCPVVLKLDVARLKVEDMINRTTSDFLVGYGQVDQPFFTMVNTDRYIIPGTPPAYVPQSTVVTISSPIVLGHNYTHYIECNGDTHGYTYKAKCVVEITDQLNNGVYTALKVTVDDREMLYEYSGAPILTPEEILQYLIELISADSYLQEISAIMSSATTIDLMSMTTTAFTVNVIANCVVIGDTEADIAFALAAAINDEETVPFITAVALGATYTVTATTYDNAYENLFENASSYHTLANLDYLNHYEVEWTIQRRATDDRQYYFNYRGPIADLASLPHILPYEGEYDVSTKLYDFYGGASHCYKSKLLSIRTKSPEILAMTKYADRFDYTIGKLQGVRVNDFGDSKLYDPNVLIFDHAGYRGTTKLNMFEWSQYKEFMYNYDLLTDTGVQLWNPDLDPPAYEPYPYSTHVDRKQWGLGGDYALSLSDFATARLRDLKFLKLNNTVFNTEFHPGFKLVNPQPFDTIKFSVLEANSLQYVIPHIMAVRISSVVDVDITNVTVIDGYYLTPGDLVLLMSQALSEENGMYVANPVMSYYTLSRHPMCDTAYKLAHAFFMVVDGAGAINKCYRVSGALTQPADTFADAALTIYEVPVTRSYADYLLDPASYWMQALAEIMNSDSHYVISMFSYAVIDDGGLVIRASADISDQQTYQFLSYVKNLNLTLNPMLTPDAITGSSATFYEPYWAYSENLMSYLETTYWEDPGLVQGSPPMPVPHLYFPNFKREDLFLHAPLTDVLNGYTHSLQYFIDNKYMELTDDGKQVGHLPSCIDGNYFQLVNTKTFSGNMDVPRYAPVFFTVNNMHAKASYEWTLVNQLTNETVMKVLDAPFFAWRFNKAGRYSLGVKIRNSSGGAGETINAIEAYVF